MFRVYGLGCHQNWAVLKVRGLRVEGLGRGHTSANARSIHQDERSRIKVRGIKKKELDTDERY